MTSHTYTTLKTLGTALVKERITGTRKGLPNRPNSHHSLRVCERLERLSAPPTTCLAGLLHDTLEDNIITPSELLSPFDSAQGLRLGFYQEIIDLVLLCSHNPTIENSTARWLLMIANLTTSKNMDAWAIKLTDLSDNLTESSGLSPDNQRFMIETKAPLLLRLTAEYPELEEYRKVLKEEVKKQQTPEPFSFGKAMLDGLNSVPRSEQF